MSNDSTLRKHLLSLKDYLCSSKEYFPGEGTKEGYSSTGQDSAGQEPTPVTSPETGQGLGPPVALREPVEHVIHGDRRIDHYAWLRKKDDPRLIAYLEVENAYLDGNLKGTEAFQEK